MMFEQFTPTERSVLNLYRSLHLSTASKYTQQQISGLTGASPSTISDTLQRLVRGGELVRVRDGNTSFYGRAILMDDQDRREQGAAYERDCPEFFKGFPKEAGE